MPQRYEVGDGGVLLRWTVQAIDGQDPHHCALLARHVPLPTSHLWLWCVDGEAWFPAKRARARLAKQGRLLACPEDQVLIKAQHVDAESYRAAKGLVRACARANTNLRLAEENLFAAFDSIGSDAGASSGIVAPFGVGSGANGGRHMTDADISAAAAAASSASRKDGGKDCDDNPDIVAAVATLQSAQRAYSHARARARRARAMHTFSEVEGRLFLCRLSSLLLKIAHLSLCHLGSKCARGYIFLSRRSVSVHSPCFLSIGAA